MERLNRDAGSWSQLLGRSAMIDKIGGGGWGVGGVPLTAIFTVYQ